MNPNHYVHCGCHGCDCFEQKSQFWGILKGGGDNYFETFKSQWLCRVRQ